MLPPPSPQPQAAPALRDDSARRGLCLVLAAPSGAGKSTLSRALRAADPAITLSVSATTRAPRSGETEGVHYFFRNDAEFAAMREAGEFLEHATVFGRSYGTPKTPVLASLAAGRDVLFDIDWQGYRQLKTALPQDIVGIFILPPSIEALAARLTGRGDPPAAITSRMRDARSEISHAGEFDYIVVNDQLDQALADITAILRAERLRPHRGGVCVLR